MSEQIPTESALSGVPSPSPAEEVPLSAEAYWDLEGAEESPRWDWMVTVAYICATGFCAVVFYALASLIEWLV